MYADPLAIAFLRSLRKEMTAVPRRLERFQRPDMDTSLETINVMLSPDMSEPYTAMSDPRDSNAGPPTAYRHVAFQGTRT